MQTTTELDIKEVHHEHETGEVGATLPLGEFAMPATKGQERFWSLDQLNPGNPALNMPLMWRCAGPVNLKQMGEAFGRLVERHESLRTTFEVQCGQLMQIIGPSWTVPMPVVDLEGDPDGEDSARTRQLTNEHAAFRMDLGHGPLLVVMVLRLSPVSHLLLVTLHHIICDGLSTGIILRDIATIYKSIIDGKDPQLPELPLQFADFAIWQQEWRDTPEYTASLDFWRRSLGTNFSRIRLRHDAIVDQKLAPGVKQAGDIVTLLLRPPLAEKVQEFCKKNFIMQNVFFSSVFTLLLNRMSGQQDLLIGSPCANRVLETENVVGMFMNIQAMRIKLEDTDTFNTLIDKVQRWTVEAYENQRLPFEDLIYDPHFSSSSSSLELPVFFLYQKSFMVTHHIGDLTIVPLRSMSPGAAFEVMFAVVDREDEGPRLQFEYNPLNFRVETVLRYLQIYVNLIEFALDDPASPLEEISRFISLPALSRVASGDAEERDSQLPRTGSASTAGASGISAPRRPAAEKETYQDAIEFQLVEMWQETLDIPSISLDDGFFTLGVSSLSALRLIVKMNRIYSTNLGLSTLFSASTIRAIAVLIRDRLTPNMHSSLVPIQPNGTKPPLFLVHGVQGNILNFYGIITHLGKDQPVYGIQAQSLLTGQSALLRLPDMARCYISEMRKVHPEGPYHLLGYSFGGIMAMEMAHQLQAAGQEIGLLGMLDSVSPASRKEMAQAGVTVRKMRAAERDAVAAEKRITLATRFKERAGRLKTRVIRNFYQLAMTAGVRSIPAVFKDVWSINHVANANYEPYLFEGKMTLFRALRQRNPYASKDLGWSSLFTGGVDVHEIPGDHLSLWAEQNSKELAACLMDALHNNKKMKTFQREG